MRIFVITGGSGFRFVAKKLRQQACDVSYGIGIADDGKSTRQFRILFDMPGIGDTRSRIIDLADPTVSGYDALKYRLPKTGSPVDLTMQFVDIAYQRTTLTSRLEGERADAIASRLLRFNQERIAAQRKGTLFDFRDASLGNAFFAGLYFEANGDLLKAIQLFSKFLNISGQIHPATIERPYPYLAARMQDGVILRGQRNITSYQNAPVEHLWFTDSNKEDAAEINPRVNPEIVEEIEQADLIVFGMGSFYTSIAVAARKYGFGKAIRKSNAPKLFLSNSVEDNETRGMSGGQMAQELIRNMRMSDTASLGLDTEYITHVIANSDLVSQNHIRPIRDGLNRDIEIIRTPLIGQENPDHYSPQRVIDQLSSFLK